MVIIIIIIVIVLPAIDGLMPSTIWQNIYNIKNGNNFDTNNINFVIILVSLLLSVDLLAYLLILVVNKYT